MKNFLLTLTLLCVGCGSLHGEYVEAEASVLEEIGPEYEALVRSGYQFDPDGSTILDDKGQPAMLPDDLKEIKLRSVRLWKARVLDAQAQIAREKAGEE